MTLIQTKGRRLAEGSGSGTDGVLTDAEKNQNAADMVKACLNECIGAMHIFLPKAEKAIRDAPGSAATIYALLGSDESQAATLGVLLRDIVNDASHKHPDWTASKTWNGV